MTVQRSPIPPSKSELNILTFPGGGKLVWAVASADDVTADFTGQTLDVFAKIERILKSAGTDQTHLVKAEVVVTDHDNKPLFDQLWGKWVPSDRGPVRSFVESRMPEGDLVELIVTAVMPEDE
ncbi:enamine deaminase RidA (YjgF/YER057c/UK114 family) [Rhodobacter aestuarii]|uniref:Enamine deaminase RidA, house cleaning of reactive enamine intermediates, YjgF/YER057c/UK114 family n=1 Tax=Rhodobacter aestuarii TaxID=453582 RepID=A0A1N7JUG4_9RHOB|nr:MULTISPECIES: Rid family hydrolase [Rhodobacter]PTV95984.1 enamine deaminase RidA (YjgF/YER057c/UK114 family) [Rhodobacter aestuarii]SIS52983.1 Enamine deaminase RidA, house cleaning of reactive enamine intermediates, YjgF/YER057c/UK114 family [Rhodobacter aestuarii]SOC10425.1 enamine deaminase RidA (YjgF/YER057c/UK114 family) [Rhodobacter sp. JA431]